jgi:hypothetical protein
MRTACVLVFKRKGELNALPGVAPWRIHDLRRSMRTNLSALGVSPFIGELAIGHRQAGVHAVYDLHRYVDEIRQALERWYARLLRIVEGPGPGKVVRLRR